MKKRSLKERREAFKKAYLDGLKDLGIIDMPKAKTLLEMTKKELIEEGNAIGITLDEKQTKKEMIAAIESFNKPVEEAIGEVVVLDEPITEENVYVEEVQEVDTDLEIKEGE